MHLSLELPPAQSNFFQLPLEIRLVIYGYMIPKRRPLIQRLGSIYHTPIGRGPTGCRMSYDINAAFFQIEKHAYEEAAIFFYSKVTLIMVISKEWGPGWMNLEYGFLATTHITTCRLGIAVILEPFTRESWKDCLLGTRNTMQAIIRQLKYLPELGKVQIMYDGWNQTGPAWRAENLRPVDQDFELQWFSMLNGFHKLP